MAATLWKKTACGISQVHGTELDVRFHRKMSANEQGRVEIASSLDIPHCDRPKWEHHIRIIHSVAPFLS
jgi:hypothetical protein